MNTDKIIAAYKIAARNKYNTFADQIVYAIARAYKHAESEGEANYLSTKYVLSMVSPVSQKRAQSEYSNDPYGALNRTLKRLSKVFQGRGVMDLKMGNLMSHSIYDAVSPSDFSKMVSAVDRLTEATSRHYVYIFVRQDIIPEQQAVQAAHATMVAGARMAGKSFNGKMFNPESTHFVLIGVPTEDHLWNASNTADSAGIVNFCFFEEDMDDQMTACCTEVVTHEKRSTFRDYGLLKFQPQQSTPPRTIFNTIRELVS